MQTWMDTGAIDDAVSMRFCGIVVFCELEIILSEREKIRHRQRSEQSAHVNDALKAMSVNQSATPPALTETAMRHPMGTLGGWMMDFGLLAASTGLMVALASWFSAAGSSMLFVLTMPIFMGALGASAGIGAGLTLRVLRGKIPAVGGIFLASIVGNFVPSMLVNMQPEGFNPLADLIRGQAGPLAIALTLLIPLAAVYRARGQRTWPAMLLAGCIAGLFIGVG